MARIPDDEIRRIKAEVPIRSYLEGRGSAFRQHGADIVCPCPFPDHDDTTPSFIVSEAKNVYHCPGCGQKGTIIDLVMALEDVGFRHAVELLREGLPALARDGRRYTTVRRLPSPVEMDAGEQAALRQVIDYYHERLGQTPDALVYLEKRGITGEAVTTFRLGFADRSLGLRLPAKQIAEGKAIRERLQRLGILRGTGHEHFRGCVTFPVFDEAGTITEVYGRKISDANAHKGSPSHLYLPGPHRGIWNPHGLHQGEGEVILCEAIIDALTFWCAGFRNVTAAYGTAGFTADHLSAFKEAGIETVRIAFDRDEAGDRAAVDVAAKLAAAGIGSYRVKFPAGMDANGFALTTTPADKSLGLVLRAAEWMGNGAQPASPAPTPTPARVAEPTPDDQADVPSLASPKAELAKETSTAPPELIPVAGEPTPDHFKSTTTGAIIRREGADIHLVLGDRGYRVRGLAKNTSYDVLQVNIRASCGSLYHIDRFDLFNARARSVFVNQAADELQVKAEAIKKDLGKVLLELERLQDEQIKAAQQPNAPTVVELTDDEQTAALRFWQSPTVLEDILDDFAALGVVGEEVNKLVGYLAAVSRKMSRPLAVLIQSLSGSGKTTLMDAVLAFIPEEERVQYSAMTAKSLFYMDQDLAHKILAIAEEEGAAQASYALKILQSEGTVSIASTGKDPETGRLVTETYQVNGPVMLFFTTTAIELDDELQNRCITLAVSEDREQTRQIHAIQRQSETLDGLFRDETRPQILKKHHDAQRLLRPLPVVNPFADDLTFLDDRPQTRREHKKYLALIRAVTLLHQFQRPRKTAERDGQRVEYIESTLEDIEVATFLAHRVLGRSLEDLPAPTRRLLGEIHAMVRELCKKRELEQSDLRFTRKDIRAFTRWGDTQLKVHLGRLVELEYLVLHQGGRGQLMVFELLWDGTGQDGTPCLPGLVDVAALRRKYGYDENRSALVARLSDGGRQDVGRLSDGGRVAESAEFPIKTREKLVKEENSAQKTKTPRPESYPDRVVDEGEAGEAVA